MPSNAKQFARQLIVEVGDVQDKAGGDRNAIFAELGQALILGTPVDTGEARESWEGTVGESSEQQVRDPGNAETGRQRFEGTALDEELFWTNNAGHIVFLDEGSSSQAPAGIVGPAVESFRDEERG